MFLTLDARPCSPQAERLLDALQILAASHEALEGRGNKRGAASADKLRLALAALMGGLLLNASQQGPKGWSYASTRANAFSGQAIAYRQFIAARRAMVAEDLIAEVEGHAEFHATGVRRWAARFRLTPKALRMARSRGMTLATMHRHWQRHASELPVVAPIVLRRLSGRIGGRKVAGEEMPLPNSRRCKAMAAEVVAFNAFLRKQDVQGCDPIVLRRQFTETLDHGGRWYGAYQSMRPAERLGITINGEAVVELDVHASGLSVAHGMLGLPLPSGDLYASIGPLPLPVVKAWTLAAIGNGGPLKRWSPSARESISKAGLAPAAYPLRRVQDVVLARYPFLKKLAPDLRCAHEPRLTSLRIQATEAAAITAAIFRLKNDAKILALPVHDALIVPASAASRALDALTEAFKTHAGIVPTIRRSKA